jgi:hypothetical protein
MLSNGGTRGNRETHRKLLYRAVPEFLHYRAGSDGTVSSCASGTWRPLKPQPAGRRGNRLRVGLYRDGGRRLSYVPHVVLPAFVRPRPPGELCCHRDDDPSNDALKNLAYRSHRENMRDGDVAARHPKLRTGPLIALSKY